MTLLDLRLLADRLRSAIREEQALGPDLGDLERRLDAATTYEDLLAVAEGLAAVPAAETEPDDLDDIWAQADPDRPRAAVPVPDAADRVRAAFTASLVGNMLGKPLEIATSKRRLQEHLEPRGEWPLVDYVTEASITSLWFVQGQWAELARERITHVAADDDISYSVLGMVALERHGTTVSQEQLRRLWLENLPVLMTYGPERTMLATAAMAALEPNTGVMPDWVRGWNLNGEWCGALIRVDAYGYACLGDPALAATIAWRDATMTHRRTGVYGAMFTAAAIAAAPLHEDRLDVFRTALRYVPQRSRFAEAVRFALDEVPAAGDWERAYDRLHDRYGEHGHCRILQEVGTMVNAVHHATDVAHGVALQVMQGNDTDSFGCSAGSILGAWFGPGHLEARWTEPFRDRIQLALAQVWVSSISELTERMAALPALVAAERDG